MNQKKERALRALVTEPTIVAAAQKAEVNERTLRRWLTDDQTFKKAASKSYEDLSLDLRQTINAAASEAVEYLHYVVSGNEYCSVKERLEACKMVLKMASPPSHIGTVAPRDAGTKKDI